MVFSSITFLYYFLPPVLLICFFARGKAENLVLAAAGLIFYGWGEGKYLFLMIAEILLAYFFSIGINSYRGKKKSRYLCVLSVVVTLSFLCYFKYAGFFLENFAKATGMEVNLLHIVLPAGISFYSFQIISYTLDVYHHKTDKLSLVDFTAYVAMFPQLIAGPIVRYEDISGELKHRKYSCSGFSYGMTRFVTGLGKKVLIADQLGELIEVIKSTEQPAVVFSAVYAVSLGLFIYFDFSGYSDMAIGLGRMLGFHFKENFNYPFMAGSITEFWQKWHISLGSWFRDYVYIPLGGNRKGLLRQLFNILTVWMLTGLWHGAGWNYILWGLYFAVLLVIEKAGFAAILKKHRVFSHFYVIILVSVSFILFDGESVSEIFTVLQNLSGLGGIPFINEVTLYYVKSYSVILLAAVAGSTPLVKNMAVRISRKAGGYLEPVYVLLLLISVTAYLADGVFNPFLYFRF